MWQSSMFQPWARLKLSYTRLLLIYKRYTSCRWHRNGRYASLLWQRAPGRLSVGESPVCQSLTRNNRRSVNDVYTESSRTRRSRLHQRHPSSIYCCSAAINPAVLSSIWKTAAYKIPYRTEWTYGNSVGKVYAKTLTDRQPSPPYEIEQK